MLDSAYVLACGSVTGALMGGSDSLGRRPTMARYKARDRRLFIAALHPKWLAKLVEMIGAPDLLKDERFASDALRQKNSDAFVEIIEQHLAQDDAAVWEQKLIQAGIPAGVVHTIQETASSQNVIDRQLISKVETETGPAHIVGSGFKMGNQPRTLHGAVPKLGEHTEEILKSLK